MVDFSLAQKNPRDALIPSHPIADGLLDASFRDQLAQKAPRVLASSNAIRETEIKLRSTPKQIADAEVDDKAYLTQTAFNDAANLADQIANFLMSIQESIDASIFVPQFRRLAMELRRRLAPLRKCGQIFVTGARQRGRNLRLLAFVRPRCTAAYLRALARRVGLSLAQIKRPFSLFSILRCCLWIFSCSNRPLHKRTASRDVGFF